MIWPWEKRRSISIDESVWARLVRALPWLNGLPASDALQLRRLMARFLTDHSITGAHGLQITDEMRLLVSVQACLPVLRLGLDAYDAFSEVIVHPSAFRVRRQIESDAGAVLEFDDILAGEAIDGGPVVISWPDVQDMSGQSDGNLVIHEFAHKLDLADGAADGCPPMWSGHRRAWMQSLHTAFDEFNRMLDRVEAAIPPEVDPESEQAAPWLSLLPLDPYAATDPAEFFAVATEKFFVDPCGLSAEFPDFYAQAVRYFGLDPRSWDRPAGESN